MQTMIIIIIHHGTIETEAVIEGTILIIFIITKMFIFYSLRKIVIKKKSQCENLKRNLKIFRN